MSELQPIDVLAAGIVICAALRGLFLGLIREVFSFCGLAAAVIAVRVWDAPVAAWLMGMGEGRIGEGVSRWIAGALIAIAMIGAVGLFGRVMSQGARTVGLGLFDRVGGAVLGVAEGAVAIGILLLVLSSVIGPDHSLLASSRSAALLARVEQFAQVRAAPTPDVAAPAPRR